MSGSSLLQNTDGQRVAVFLAVAGLHRGNDHEDNPEDEDDGENEESDQDKAENAGQSGVKGVADLEVEDFLAGAVKEGAVRAFDQPEDERGDDVAEWKDEAGEAEELRNHGEGVVGGGLVRWRGKGRWLIFHGGEIVFWGVGVNAETAKGAARRGECELPRLSRRS